MKPEVRKAQRDQAIKWVICLLFNLCAMNNFASFIYRVAKDQKKATKAAKKVTTAPSKPKQAKVKATKVTQKAAPRVGGKR